MSMIIRKALPEDAAAIAEIDRVSSAHPWTEQQFAEEIVFAQAYTCVCDLDGRTVGFATMQNAAEFAHINELAVLPECRRMGIGRAMMEDIVRECAARGCESVSLEVRQSNLPARALYGAFGFRQEGIRRNFYREPAEDALVLVSKLKEETDIC